MVAATNAYSRIISVTPQGAVTKIAEGRLFDITSSVAFVPGGDPSTLYVGNFGFPALGGNRAFAGALKLDLTSKAVTPVACFNQDTVFSPIHHATFGPAAGCARTFQLRQPSGSRLELSPVGARGSMAMLREHLA